MGLRLLISWPGDGNIILMLNVMDSFRSGLGSLKGENQRCVRRIPCSLLYVTLKMKGEKKERKWKGTLTKECGQPLETGKIGMGFLPEVSGKKALLKPWFLAQWDLHGTDLQKHTKNVLTKSTKFAVICYNGNKELVQSWINACWLTELINQEQIYYLFHLIILLVLRERRFSLDHVISL